MKETTSTSLLTREQLLSLYHRLLTPRLIEERMLILLRQGKISKWFSGIGQEAISVGCTAALQNDEMIFPMHRNLGVFTTRDIPLYRLFAQWQGKAEGFTQGRDRSFHFGTLDYHIVGMISHLGPQLSLAAGVAMSYKLRGLPKVALAFTGEGGTSQGEFHEALNVAAVWSLPVIFVIENNGYGLSTPVSEQYACQSLADKGLGYGIESHIIDGNDLMQVYTKMTALAASVRERPRPILIEAITFRMRGHEEASGTKYVPEDLMQSWAAKDPVATFEHYLLDQELCTSEHFTEAREDIKAHILADLAKADSLPMIIPDTATELGAVYRPAPPAPPVQDSPTAEMRYIDAISSALDRAMVSNDELVLMGQDIADYGGVFKITDGFLAKFGTDRVRNTPLCESAIVGISMGLSFEGIPSMMEMQFSDFVTCGFNQIVNNLAKVHYRWGHAPNVVIRMPSGGGVGAGPFHSQTTESWFTHIPGLKIVYPATPSDAKGLLQSAFTDPNPVLYFEHKKLYRTVTEAVPTQDYFVEIGKARIARQGRQATIVTYGMGVHWALELVERLKLDVEVIDLRTLVPLDHDAISASVMKTSRVMVLCEDTQFSSFGAEVAAWVSEHLFQSLDAPVARVGSLDTPIPFHPDIERVFLADHRLESRLIELLEY